MLGLALVITPLYVILMEFPIRSVYNFGLIIFLGIVGMTTGVTIIGAIVAKASMKGTLFPILSFPIIIPLLLAVIEGTSMAARSASFGQTMQTTSVIIAFTGATFVLSLLLFDKVWLE
jgi:heme exporter protein B